MAEDYRSIVRREVRSPRAAAIAGIVYSLLMCIIMIFSYKTIQVRPENITEEWVQGLPGNTSLVIALIPFAGIAFLWFTGVVRDQLSYQEGRFFATLFLGSGIIYVLLLFLWSAIFGAIIFTSEMRVAGLASSGMYIFGIVLMNEIIGSYSLRMAAIYMTAIGALWGRTGLMPRWMTIITYVLALGFLLFANTVREARFLFYGWVLLVSAYILVLNYRRRQDQEDQYELSMDA